MEWMARRSYRGLGILARISQSLYGLDFRRRAVKGGWSTAYLTAILSG